jgi:hypothetical protein
MVATRRTPLRRACDRHGYMVATRRGYMVATRHDIT